MRHLIIAAALISLSSCSKSIARIAGNGGVDPYPNLSLNFASTHVDSHVVYCVQSNQWDSANMTFTLSSAGGGYSFAIVFHCDSLAEGIYNLQPSGFDGGVALYGQAGYCVGYLQQGGFQVSIDRLVAGQISGSFSGTLSSFDAGYPPTFSVSGTFSNVQIE